MVGDGVVLGVGVGVAESVGVKVVVGVAVTEGVVVAVDVIVEVRAGAKVTDGARLGVVVSLVGVLVMMACTSSPADLPPSSPLAEIGMLTRRMRMGASDKLMIRGNTRFICRIEIPLWIMLNVSL